MKILFAIAHYYNPTGSGRHGSLRPDPQPRILALTACIESLHQTFGRGQTILRHDKREAHPANEDFEHEIKVVVCTTGGKHLTTTLASPKPFFETHATDVEPLFLGFECQRVLRDHLGRYDYYCFLEDDLIIQDSMFFSKLRWFTNHNGNASLLQPNRFELAAHGETLKAFIDGDLNPRATAPFQNIEENRRLMLSYGGMHLRFARPLNPHSGCYFLNAEQMAHGANQKHFLDRDARFIDPMASAATLGIMKCVPHLQTRARERQFSGNPPPRHRLHRHGRQGNHAGPGAR